VLKEVDLALGNNKSKKEAKKSSLDAVSLNVNDWKQKDMGIEGLIQKY